MSRENILNKLKANKPGALSNLPLVPDFQKEGIDLIKLFQLSLENNKATVLTAPSSADLGALIKKQYPDVEQIISTIPSFAGNVENVDSKSAKELALLDLAVVQGELGVADTGAIWVSDKTLPLRVVPFIARYLVIVIEAKQLVYSMHQAYAALQPQNVGYGVFISGPSKTGDIEQALVIGAQGPLGLTVIITT